MTASKPTSPARHFDTLVSPLESADEPHWLQRASPEQRRRLRAHQQQGQHARRLAAQAFAEVHSLYHAHRAALTGMDWSAVTADTLLANGQSQALASTYARHLEQQLNTATLRGAKEDAYVATLREEFTRADIRGDVDKAGKRMVQWFIDAYPSGSAEFKQIGPFVGKEVAICSSLRLLTDLPLPDIILFGPEEDDSVCVAFVPGHPRHPIKQYPSRARFYASLRRDLLDPQWQGYFSRFVPLRRQHQALATWADREALLDLPMSAAPLEQGLRAFAYEQMVARLLDDARYLIPLDAEQARALRYLSPSYAHALDEHIMLGSGVGLSRSEEVECQAPSDWVAPLRVVQPSTTSGYQRWLPDLSSYRLDAASAPTGQPDSRGLYTYAQGQAVAINQAFYRVAKTAAGTWQILHPSTPGVYLPLLRHNGQGAWHHSLEQPQRWSRLALLRRLGPLSTGLTDERLLQLARVCGVSNAQLRQMYLRDQPLPTLLRYVMERARIQDEVATVLLRIVRGQPVDATDEVETLKAFYRAVAIYNGEPAPLRRAPRSPDATPASGCDDTCNPPPRELYLQWFPRLSRAIAEHRFELLQLDTDHAVQELQRRYPHMPLSVAQRFLDANRERLHSVLQTTTEPMPMELCAVAQALDYDARLTHALEGFTVPATINEDTFILAFGLLEHLDGWLPGTALLLRRGDRYGQPLAELGETDVETTALYLDDEEGWSTTSATQVLLAQDMTQYGFYRAVLYALSEQQRALLGLGLNEPERLHQLLQEMALARPTRARLLLGLPVNRSWLTPASVAAVQRSPSQLDADLFMREPIHLRLERLLTQTLLPVPELSAQRYIHDLLERGEPIGERVQALEQQRAQLQSRLSLWIEQSVGQPSRRQRTEAAGQLLLAWESRITLREASLVLGGTALTGLTPLPVNLPAVIALTLTHVRQLDALPGLLQRLPNLRRLEMVNMPLTEVPPAVLQMRYLRQLNLSRTRISADRLGVLGSLGHLESLTLNEMDLGSFYWTAQDMHRLTASGSLQMLTIERAHADFGAGVFAALARLPALHSLSLSGNDIGLTQQDVIALASLEQLRSLDLSLNPLMRMPDLSRMQHLEEVDLSRLEGDVSGWPTGLELLPTIQAADLRFVAISSVPPSAGCTRGLRMSSAGLPEPERQRFLDEMRSVGNHGSDSDESRGEDSDFGDSSDADGSDTWAARNDNTLRNAPRLFDGLSEEDHARATQLLASGESATAEFFALLLRIDVSPEAQRPEAGLRSRIQALIRGAFDSDLRRALHEQARQAVSCVDRDALVFSQMENLLHADQALARASDGSAAHELIALATSHWRVQRLKEYVTAQITGWRLRGHVIDYSEIELYFRIALAPRLSLRDQPHAQVFTSYTRWVTQAMLDAAYDAVLAPQTELLPHYLNAQPYWQRFLDYAHAPRIEAIHHWRNRIGEYLDAVSTDDELPPTLDDSERQRLHQVLVSSGQLTRLQPLPDALRLNSNQYREAYAALLRLVEQARMELTQAILEPQPGPSSSR